MIFADSIVIIILAVKAEFDVKKEIHFMVNTEDLVDFNSYFNRSSHCIYDIDQRTGKGASKKL
ncbi:hypothetical protein [Chryseobacterium sp. SIMBA_028]|uniref:hypothetical protein n=1 Tax=Chryseobacterium sp. SIMBA_028 TaxID=3085771 RepID=UPI00397E86F9